MTAGVASERNRVAIWDAEVIRSQLQRMIAIADKQRTSALRHGRLTSQLQASASDHVKNMLLS